MASSSYEAGQHSTTSSTVAISRSGRAISNELRQRLTDAHQSGVTYKQMTRLYGVKKDTAYRICSTRQYSTKLRGGPRGKKLDEDSISLLLITIEACPDMTLGEMRNKLLLERGITVSISTIARCLEGCLITVKKLELLPSVRNSPANKECRRTHALWLQEQLEIGARFCYVDECGFGLYTARNRGRSMQGLPARRVADNQRTPHVTLICAICPGVGLVHSKILLGGAKQTHFDQFMSELFHLSFGLALEPSSSVDTAFIVLDNAP